ncbi:MAG: hypothetical protein EKK40_11035 [Bradyrhizobiaceae bacterium]|nr:MAG: hypothetical protein EKK40_11035 [Bradyrhizobiaceae bacterium]
MRIMTSIVAGAAVCFVLSSAYAETAETFGAAYAKAEAANKKAGELRNQWTTTGAALKDAKKAADGGDFDAATNLAKKAEALANASIAQSQREDKLWTESEIR